jgi:carbonic anhydrase/acetyltransferase-like protein (isoleucine patch superfamily)
MVLMRNRINGGIQSTKSLVSQFKNIARSVCSSSLFKKAFALGTALSLVASGAAAALSHGAVDTPEKITEKLSSSPGSVVKIMISPLEATYWTVSGEGKKALEAFANPCPVASAGALDVNKPKDYNYNYNYNDPARNVTVHDEAHIHGNITLGENVYIGPNVYLSGNISISNTTITGDKSRKIEGVNYATETHLEGEDIVIKDSEITAGAGIYSDSYVEKAKLDTCVRLGNRGEKNSGARVVNSTIGQFGIIEGGSTVLNSALGEGNWILRNCLVSGVQSAKAVMVCCGSHIEKSFLDVDAVIQNNANVFNSSIGKYALVNPGAEITDTAVPAYTELKGDIQAPPSEDKTHRQIVMGLHSCKEKLKNLVL